MTAFVLPLVFLELAFLSLLFRWMNDCTSRPPSVCSSIIIAIGITLSRRSPAFSPGERTLMP